VIRNASNYFSDASKLSLTLLEKYCALGDAKSTTNSSKSILQSIQELQHPFGDDLFDAFIVNMWFSFEAYHDISSSSVKVKRLNTSSDLNTA